MLTVFITTISFGILNFKPNKFLILKKTGNFINNVNKKYTSYFFSIFLLFISHFFKMKNPISKTFSVPRNRYSFIICYYNDNIVLFLFINDIQKTKQN